MPALRILSLPISEIVLKPALYASLFFIVLTIPFVLYLTSKIVKPIRDLTKENKKVIQRKFSEVIPIETDIKELYVKFTKNLTSFLTPFCA